MGISKVTVRRVDVGQGFSWGDRRSMNVEAVWVTLASDSGHTGHGMAWTGDLPAVVVTEAIESVVAPSLAGASPFERPVVMGPAWRAFRSGMPLAAIGVVDMAMWDLAGHITGRSVAELLGRRHTALPSCASAPPEEDAQACAEMVQGYAQQGFRAVKLHACGDVRADIAACRASREAVGEGVGLMMDAMAIYHRDDALRLGKVLDECGFVWFEDPLPDDDLDGWIELRRRIDTPVAGVDAVRFSIKEYSRAAANGAFDILRMDAARDGISQLAALSALAESFSLGCEGHAFGPALAQAANLQVGLASAGARYCELPVPLGGMDFGVEAGLALHADGCVHAPPGPGLGLAVDVDALDSALVG
jgi:L-alanine-DL-glutamate epimerase-like enolase superfamily enzyme